MITLQLERLGLADGMRVLDLGCGRGRHLHALYWCDHALDVVGLDLDFNDLSAAIDGFFELPPPPDHPPRSAVFATGDAARLPFADDSFDAVICSEVLEHVEAVAPVLEEIDRVLKPGGAFALSVPRAWPERICWALSQGYRNTPGGHVRIFRDAALRREVEALGYRATAKHGAHALHSPYWWLQCALWERREDSLAVAAYRRFLEWDLLEAPRITRGLESLLNPVLGKSVALYFRKAAA